MRIDGAVLPATALLAVLLAGCGQGGGGGSAAAPTPLSPKDKTLLAALPPPFDHGDLDNGRLHFSLCRSCHTINPGGANMTGPNLYGVFTRGVAAKPDFSYSAALKAKGGMWDAAKLDRWIKSPQTDVPGTKMTFVGIKDPTDRRDVIAYLKVVSSGGSQ